MRNHTHFRSVDEMRGKKRWKCTPNGFFPLSLPLWRVRCVATFAERRKNNNNFRPVNGKRPMPFSITITTTSKVIWAFVYSYPEQVEKPLSSASQYHYESTRERARGRRRWRDHKDIMLNLYVKHENAFDHFRLSFMRLDTHTEYLYENIYLPQAVAQTPAFNGLLHIHRTTNVSAEQFRHFMTQAAHHSCACVSDGEMRRQCRGWGETVTPETFHFIRKVEWIENKCEMWTERW